MNRTGNSPRGWVMAGALVALAGLTSYSAQAGATSPSGPGPSGPQAPAPAIPLPTSAITSRGDWATVPMGHLKDPADTFWQLFHDPEQSAPGAAARWANKVEATATATNGGLVLASDGRRFLVGVRPSFKLTYTPLISTSDGGNTWSTGLLLRQLAARPDALAVSGQQELALVTNHRQATVMIARGTISHWTELVTRAQLASAPGGRSCDVGVLTAVGYRGGQPVVGASCTNPGTVGLFSPSGHKWALVGARVPASLRGWRAEVLGTGPGEHAPWVLVAFVLGRRTDLATFALGPGKSYTTSPPLALDREEQIASFGPAGADKVFVLLTGASKKGSLLIGGTQAHGWEHLAAPPTGTVTIAFAPGHEPQALVPKGDRLSFWSLEHRRGAWSRSEVLRVPIQYGSSS